MDEKTIQRIKKLQALAERGVGGEKTTAQKQEQKKEKYHNTFTLMKCYRDAVFHIENAISDGQQLELKGMTDEQQRTYLESIRRTRFKTLIMTAHIDKAVEEIERRREAAGRGVEYKA